jgi:hypothetical protein
MLFSLSMGNDSLDQCPLAKLQQRHLPSVHCLTYMYVYVVHEARGVKV